MSLLLLLRLLGLALLALRLLPALLLRLLLLPALPLLLALLLSRLGPALLRLILLLLLLVLLSLLLPLLHRTHRRAHAEGQRPDDERQARAVPAGHDHESLPSITSTSVTEQEARQSGRAVNRGFRGL